MRPTEVDVYWGTHTINPPRFSTPRESEEYLEWRFREYPRFRELMELWGEHDDEVVVDYRCGPGNDLVGFLLNTAARRVVGVDVSPLALDLARIRLGLHRVDQERIDLIQVSDGETTIPLDDGTVDFVNCGGVLHHVSDPAAILREFRRVLRPEGRANVMVYNRESVWYHLYAAYVLRVVERKGDGLSVDAVFARSTDGEDCPISVPYRPSVFLALANEAGLQGEFVGGYLSLHELAVLNAYGEAARADEGLAGEHRDFLARLDRDARGLPRSQGMYAGVGGTYHLGRAR